MDYLESIPLAASRRPPPDEPYLSIDDACLIVDNGDIVLFSGESQFSGLITLFCGSQWSHIAIVYRPIDGLPMLFESVKSDDDPNKPVGVRLLPFRESLLSFKGKSMALRCLCIPECVQYIPGVVDKWRDHLYKCMRKCVQRHQGKKYEDRILNFIFARFSSFHIDYETRDRLFCSELVAICYQTMKILDPNHSTIQFIPDDFCEAGKVSLTMPIFVHMHTVDAVDIRLGLQMFIRNDASDDLQNDVGYRSDEDEDDDGEVIVEVDDAT